MTRSRHLSRQLVAARLLVGHRRSQGRDYGLALFLALVAGASNAGGFFALAQYTSHMTGYLSQIADNLVVGNLVVLVTAVLAIASFTTGAAISAVLVNWARERRKGKHFALPLAVQGTCLACFALAGAFTTETGRIFALAWLCGIMGMQNATITKISGARIRTTHATGMITDIGIEAGRAIHGRLWPESGVKEDREKLRILVFLVGAYVLGGVVGATGYLVMGFYFALPLAALLLALSLPSLLRRTRPYQRR